MLRTLRIAVGVLAALMLCMSNVAIAKPPVRLSIAASTNTGRASVTSAAQAPTILVSPLKLPAGSAASLRVDAGDGARACSISASSGKTRSKGYAYKIAQPILSISWRVPKAAGTASWSVRIACASSSKKLKSARPVKRTVKVAGKKHGKREFFSSLKLVARARNNLSSAAHEPSASGSGGKGGYSCASADNNGRSVLDSTTYCTGYCTWFVYTKRPEAGLRNLGDASTWYENTSLPKGRTPSAKPVVGAIAWWGSEVASGEGHVALVTAVSGNTITVDEMNVRGWNVEDTQTMAATAPDGYIYGGPAGGGGTGGPAASGGSGTGNADVIARAPDGDLFLYRGDGHDGWLGVVQIGSGWGGYTDLIAPGDFDHDGNADVIARAPDGDLFLYRGDGHDGWLGVVQIGSGWGGYTDLIAPGDFDHDGNADVIARAPDGDLFLYRGDGHDGWLGVVQIGSGWGGYTDLIAPGDFDHDGNADVIARAPDGDLFLYRGDGHYGWIGGGIQIGSGWGGYTDLIAPGDFDHDGNADVIARAPDGDLFLYRGDGHYGWIGGGIQIGSGWGGYTDLIAPGDFDHS